MTLSHSPFCLNHALPRDCLRPTPCPSQAALRLPIPGCSRRHPLGIITVKCRCHLLPDFHPSPLPEPPGSLASAALKLSHSLGCPRRPPSAGRPGPGPAQCSPLHPGAPGNQPRGPVPPALLGTPVLSDRPVWGFVLSTLLPGTQFQPPESPHAPRHCRGSVRTRLGRARNAA